MNHPSRGSTGPERSARRVGHVEHLSLGSRWGGHGRGSRVLQDEVDSIGTLGDEKRIHTDFFRSFKDDFDRSDLN